MASPVQQPNRADHSMGLTSPSWKYTNATPMHSMMYIARRIQNTPTLRKLWKEGVEGVQWKEGRQAGCSARPVRPSHAGHAPLTC